MDAFVTNYKYEGVKQTGGAGLLAKFALPNPLHNTLFQNLGIWMNINVDFFSPSISLKKII